jgi:hypothetical protein
VALVPFTTVDRSVLRWLRTADKPFEFTLSSGDRILSVLRWEKSVGSLATAETSDARWTLKRVGFLNPHLTLRGPGADADIARLTVHAAHHRIEFASGLSYRFHRAGLLVPAWLITTDRGAELVHIEPVREGRKLSGGAVLVNAAAQTQDELATLLVLSWYFIVLAWFEDEALIPLEGDPSDSGKS